MEELWLWLCRLWRMKHERLEFSYKSPPILPKIHIFIAYKSQIEWKSLLLIVSSCLLSTIYCR